jgi:hypothetical protein
MKSTATIDEVSSEYPTVKLKYIVDRRTDKVDKEDIPENKIRSSVEVST